MENLVHFKPWKNNRLKSPSASSRFPHGHMQPPSAVAPPLPPSADPGPPRRSAAAVRCPDGHCARSGGVASSHPHPPGREGLGAPATPEQPPDDPHGSQDARAFPWRKRKEDVGIRTESQIHQFGSLDEIANVL